MADVSRAILKYIEENIRLNLPDIQRSAASREWMKGRIESKIAQRAAQGAKEPALYSQKPFVNFGSYFKQTKVQVVDEYDILVVIDANNGYYQENYLKIATGVGSVNLNNVWLNRYKKEDSNYLSPVKLLNWLKEVVTDIITSYGGSAPERGGQAITATIKSSNIDIDLVPALILQRDSDLKFFYIIPAGTRGSDWIMTAPEDDIKLLNDCTVDRPHFKNVIRICKRIKDKYNFLVPSFAIETAVIWYIHENSWFRDDIFANLRGVLSLIATAFRAGFIADSFDKSKNLVSGVTYLDWYAERIDRIIGTLDFCVFVTDQNTAYEKIRRAFENE